MKITDSEKLILNKALQNERKSYSLFLTASIMAIFSVFISKHNRPSLYDNFGFIMPFLVLFSLFLILFYWEQDKAINKIKNDLTAETKISSHFKIIDKDTNMKNECFIVIDIPIEKLKKHKIDKSDFSKLKIGDSILFEYFPHSEIFIRIDVKSIL